MSDPAIDAANRAWLARVGGFGSPTPLKATLPYGRDMTAAAREALAPIRAVLDKLAEDTFPPCDFGKRIDLYEKAISALSPLCYTSEELANG